MKLSAITSKAVTSSIDFGNGETLQITYNPAQFTPKFFQSITHEDGKNKVTDLAVFINSLVSAWDLTNEDGSLFPLDVDSLCSLPIEFLGKVVDKINSDNNPNPPSSAPSSFG